MFNNTNFGNLVVKDDCQMFKCHVHNQWWIYDHRHISGGGRVKH